MVQRFHDTLIHIRIAKKLNKFRFLCFCVYSKRKGQRRDREGVREVEKKRQMRFNALIFKFKLVDENFSFLSILRHTVVTYGVVQ